MYIYTYHNGWQNEYKIHISIRFRKERRARLYNAHCPVRTRMYIISSLEHKTTERENYLLRLFHYQRRVASSLLFLSHTHTTF